MEKHNAIFSLKNFRSFGEEGADFELAPITVLTGCNSAGKSSMAKALMLMSNLPKERNAICPSLKLYSKDLGLGQFDKILNLSALKKEIEFSYEIWSNYLQELVIVRRYFKAQKSDALNDGYLCRYSVEKKDGTVIYEKGTSIYGMEEEKKVNIEAVRCNYDRFTDIAKYMRLKKRTMVIELDMKRIIEIKEDLNKEERKIADGEEKEYAKKLEIINAVVEKYGINIIDSYKYKQLNSWNSWYEKREAEIERTKNNKILDDEQMELHYPKDEPLERFVELAIDEVFYPWFIEDIEYVDSASASIRRVYSIEEDNKMNKALRVLNSRSVVDYELSTCIDVEEEYLKPGWFINKWLKKFDLGDGIEISGDEGGIKVYLKKDNKKRLLADEGYGVTQLVSLLLIIENAIRSETDSETPIKDGKPEFQQIAVSRPSRYICVEEPENHLHPKFQSLLADMFVEAYQKYNIHFIIETHSEYLIRKLQVMVADKENSLASSNVSLNYVKKDENGTSHNRNIEIRDDGSLLGEFGTGFYDEAVSLSMQLFGSKKILS